MDYFEAVAKRRSIRKFSDKEFPKENVRRALEAALLAPNSSNVQTWDFHWIQTPDMMTKVRHACMNQAAARTANQLVVVTADPAKWTRSRQPLIEFIDSVKAPRPVQHYYRKQTKLMYTWGFLNSFALIKIIRAFVLGFSRPVERRQHTRRDLQEVAMKSAALASENFVLAIVAQGGSTCMMEGFDEARMKSLLKLPCSARVVMVIAVGFEGERATWGPQFRLPFGDVVHVH